MCANQENGITNEWRNAIHVDCTSLYCRSVLLLPMPCILFRLWYWVKRRRRETANKQQPKPQEGSFGVYVFSFISNLLIRIRICLSSIMICFHKFFRAPNSKVPFGLLLSLLLSLSASSPSPCNPFGIRKWKSFRFGSRRNYVFY